MLKKVMLYLMILLFTSRVFGMIFLLSSGLSTLPLPVYVSSGIVALVGVALTCKGVIRSVGRRELCGFYLLLCISVVFNLIFMKVTYPMELTFIHLTVIGSLLDLVLGVAFILLSIREDKYVRIHMK